MEVSLIGAVRPPPTDWSHAAGATQGAGQITNPSKRLEEACTHLESAVKRARSTLRKHGRHKIHVSIGDASAAYVVASQSRKSSVTTARVKVLGCKGRQQ